MAPCGTRAAPLVVGLLLLSLRRIVRDKANLAPLQNGRRIDSMQPVNCLQQRGESGRWVQDWAYANATKYPNHGSYSNWHVAAQNFVPSAEQPFRKATSWVWQDEHCPVTITAKASFCQACHALNISRILVVGDSLSIEFTRSLVSLLGHPPGKGPASRFNAHFRPMTIDCPSSRIVVLGSRKSPIENWHSVAAEVDEIEAYRNNHTNATQAPKPNKLRQFVKKDSMKTAIVANLGAWIKTHEDYEIGFDALVRWIGTFDNVIPFFRETIPGHDNCQPNVGEQSDYNWTKTVDEEPFASYSDYAASIGNDTYARGMFEAFNAYSKEQIRVKATNIHWLNVFNSSVLRLDGHIGWGDCLHYYLPGPPDWWVHFFHSALLDLASQQATSKFLVSQI